MDSRGGSVWIAPMSPSLPQESRVMGHRSRSWIHGLFDCWAPQRCCYWYRGGAWVIDLWKPVFGPFDSYIVLLPPTSPVAYQPTSPVQQQCLPVLIPITCSSGSLELLGQGLPEVALVGRVGEVAVDDLAEGPLRALITSSSACRQGLRAFMSENVSAKRVLLCLLGHVKRAEVLLPGCLFVTRLKGCAEVVGAVKTVDNDAAEGA